MANNMAESKAGGLELAMGDEGLRAMRHAQSYERLMAISVAAYYKAKARGFRPGFEEADWVAAEKDFGVAD